MKTLFAMFLLCTAVPQAWAALDFYDSFNYTPTGIALTNAAPNIWVPGTGALVNGQTNNPGSLTYPGLQTTPGDNSALFQGTGAAGNDIRNLSTLYNIGNLTTLYYSLVFQVTSVSGNDWGGSGNWISGSFMLGFNQKLRNNAAVIGQGDAGAPLLIRTGNPSNVGGTADTTSTFQLGTSPTATTANRTFDSTHTYNVGDVLFLVLSYTFGSGASDDVAKLWVNPVPGTAEGANTPVVIAGGGLTDITGNQIQSFFLRNNSVEPASTVIDELRVGTTWEDVTPVPEPAAGILSSMGVLALMTIRRFRR